MVLKIQIAVFHAFPFVFRDVLEQYVCMGTNMGIWFYKSLFRNSVIDRVNKIEIYDLYQLFLCVHSIFLRSCLNSQIYHHWCVFLFPIPSTTVVLSPPYVRFKQAYWSFRYTTYVFSIKIIALYKVLQNPLAVINYHLKN